MFHCVYAKQDLEDAYMVLNVLYVVMHTKQLFLTYCLHYCMALPIEMISVMAMISISKKMNPAIKAIIANLREEFPFAFVARYHDMPLRISAIGGQKRNTIPKSFHNAELFVAKDWLKKYV